MNLPSHHQSDFLRELRVKVPTFSVLYYGKVSTSRVSEGWEKDFGSSDFERFVDPSMKSLTEICGWRDGIHVIPGYGNRFLRELASFLGSENVQWVHWSEKASPGLRWLLSFPIKRLHASRVNRHALGVFAIGSSAANDFVRWGIRREKIANLPYSITNVAREPADPQLMEFKQGRKSFLFVGSLYSGKGIDLLLSAYAQIANILPDWCVILVGNDRTEGKYQKMVTQLGLEGRVFFRGVISSARIGAAYSAADVFVLPSRYDGWGMVVNEAAAMGLPLIVSDAAGAAWHMVDHAVNGFRFASGDAAALRDAMLAYGRAPQLLPLHGEASKRVFAANSSAVMADRFLTILQTWQAVKKK